MLLFYVPVRISVVTTIKSLPAHLTKKRFLSCMYSSMFFEMLWIYKSCLTYSTFKRSFSCMCCFYVIIQQSSSFKSFSAIFTFVPFIVVMSSSFMRLQIGALAERSPAKLTLVRAFSGMRSFMVSYFCFSSKRFTTKTADKWFVASMYNRMNF